MERIVYRKTLDVHKGGVQFLLQGFETADRLSRTIEISLMANGDAMDIPLGTVSASMYVKTPNTAEKSICECEIRDNKIIYDVIPIVEEGITEMQLEIISTRYDGEMSVLASPKFAVEVLKSDTDDEDAKQAISYSAIETAISKAQQAYDSRLLRIELDSECIFRAYYSGDTEEHGVYYETDVLQRLFLNGNVLLSESYAHGGTGVRTGEDQDNSKYYSNVSKSEALKAQDIMSNSKAILDEVMLHGVYTAFSVDFETGEVEYVSPSYKFNINSETGELDAVGQAYTFEEEIERLVKEWLANNGVNITDLQTISTTHSANIEELYNENEAHNVRIGNLETEIRPVTLGGTGASTPKEALANLGITSYVKPCDYSNLITKLSCDSADDTGTTWTATQDCWVMGSCGGSANWGDGHIYIDDNLAMTGSVGTASSHGDTSFCLYVLKGAVIKIVRRVEVRVFGCIA